jgi:carbon storage regulator
MLVFSRKEGQAFHIDGGIVVRIMRIRNGQVSIGVEAPREIGVFREELVSQVPAEIEEDRP